MCFPNMEGLRVNRNFLRNSLGSSLGGSYQLTLRGRVAPAFYIRFGEAIPDKYAREIASYLGIYICSNVHKKESSFNLYLRTATPL